MIIDIHTHIADLRTSGDLERLPVTVESLLARLDEEGIDRAVVLPLWPNPEGIHFPYLFSPLPDPVAQIRAAAAHRDRLIPFGNVDPRAGGNTARTDYGWVFERFIELGCAGIGEVTANLDADDPRVINFFRQCGRWDLPVLIHVIGPGEGHYGLIDEPGSPRLERLLQAVPETIVVGHGQGFWAEFAPVTAEGKSGYPKGPVEEEGSLWRLMRTCPNLHCDISAGSGHNALTRDREAGLRFLHEFAPRIHFGTDVCFDGPKDRMPHLKLLRGLLAEGALSAEQFEAITGGNTLRILKRYAPASCTND